MTISKQVLSKYSGLAKVFVETGTHIGKTTELALQLGFQKIYTIELADHFYQRAVKMFARYPQVCCIHGDSQEQLKVILSELNEPAVFWLDGHWSMGDTAKGSNAVPIYEELASIESHHIKNHVILIDDLRLMGNKDEPIAEWHDISIDDIKERCLRINSKYKFSFEDGHVRNDILVAREHK